MVQKNRAHVEFNDKKFKNVRFVRVNSMPAVGENLTAKAYVDQAFSNYIEESSLLKLDLDEKLKLDELDAIILISSLISPKKTREIAIEAYVDSLSENETNRCDMKTVFVVQDNEFDNNQLTNLDSFTVIGNPTIDNEISDKKHVDDSIREGGIPKKPIT